MPRPADQRRAQATAEWLAVVAAVAAVGLGAALWTDGTVPTRLARLLAEPRSEAHVAARTIADSLQARPGALSVLGTEAWLIEERGAPAARAELARKKRRSRRQGVSKPASSFCLVHWSSYSGFSLASMRRIAAS